MLDTYVCESEYLDGDTVKLTYNRIYKAVYKVMKPYWNEFILLDSILDHHKDAAAITKGYRGIQI